MRCWGFGADGRLGYGDQSNIGDVLTPAAAGPVDFGAGRTARAITAGGAHTCAILDDDSVRCWGFDANGQLGYGNTSGVGAGDTPRSVGRVDLGAGRTAVAISAGSSHTCAILDNGRVLCWGYGGNGRLGYGNTNDVGNQLTPGQVGPVNLGPGRTARAITAGDTHTCVILDDGSVRCWGPGFEGQLGYGNQNNAGDRLATTPDKLEPVNLGGHSAAAISAGSSFTCAILDDGSVRCWGYGADGRLGYGNTSNVGDTPATLPGVVGPVDLGAGRTAVAISAGGSHACARLDDGRVRCWGYGAYGQLGYCNTNNVGDLQTPGSAGPVNLVAGDGGALCPGPLPLAVPVDVSPPSITGQAVAGEVLTEADGTWSPTPTAYTYQWERCTSAGGGCGAIQGAGAQTYALTAGDVGSAIRVLETASDAGGAGISAPSAPSAVVTATPVPALSDANAARARRYRACLASVAADAKVSQALTHRGS